LKIARNFHAGHTQNNVFGALAAHMYAERKAAGSSDAGKTYKTPVARGIASTGEDRLWRRIPLQI
jgi:hypothetical protein